MGRKNSIGNRTLKEDVLLALRIGIPVPLIADIFHVSPVYVRSLIPRGGREKIIVQLYRKEEESSYDPELEAQRSRNWRIS